MSENWVQDIHEMHKKYGVHEWMKKATNHEKIEYLKFRIKFLYEELNETEKAFVQDDSEEIVDGLIDLCVVAIGTLDAYGIDSHKAWNEVLKCNMEKEVGIKPERSNPLGLPDLIKPLGWKAPNHEGNHGLL